MKRAAMPSENEIRENLTDAGCSRDETESILTCIRSGDIKAAGKIIAASRKKQLQKLHESQRCIDRLDYLCFQMRSI